MDEILPIIDAILEELNRLYQQRISSKYSKAWLIAEQRQRIFRLLSDLSTIPSDAVIKELENSWENWKSTWQ